jgi:hypothetical protein
MYMCGLPTAQCNHYQEHVPTFMHLHHVRSTIGSPNVLQDMVSHFMYHVNSIFMPELEKFFVVFIDYILVYSKSMEEHEEQL